MAKKDTGDKRGKKRVPSHMGEAAAGSRGTPIADRGATIATTRLSGKNQITVPVAMCRLMDMRPGDEIELLVVGDTVYMQRLPRTPEEWAHRFDNSPSTGAWGNNDKEIDANLRAEREGWDKEYDWPDRSS